MREREREREKRKEKEKKRGGEKIIKAKHAFFTEQIGKQMISVDQKPHRWCACSLDLVSEQAEFLVRFLSAFSFTAVFFFFFFFFFFSLSRSLSLSLSLFLSFIHSLFVCLATGVKGVGRAFGAAGQQVGNGSGAAIVGQGLVGVDHHGRRQEILRAVDQLRVALGIRFVRQPVLIAVALGKHLHHRCALEQGERRAGGGGVRRRR